MMRRFHECLGNFIYRAVAADGNTKLAIPIDGVLGELGGDHISVPVGFLNESPSTPVEQAAATCGFPGLKFEDKASLHKRETGSES